MLLRPSRIFARGVSNLLSRRKRRRKKYGAQKGKYTQTVRTTQQIGFNGFNEEEKNETRPHT